LRSIVSFILPFFEGLPVTLLECMSLGVVTIAAPVDFILDILEENQNGMFIKI
jgi:glycosyltransferase involved in cell wall biosynthesis